MAAFFDFSRKHKHHEWSKGFCDICYWWIWRYSYEIVRAGVAWSNFHSSKCTSLRVFDWLVIELSVAKLVVKCWQRHIWINSTAKPIFYRSAAAFFGHTTNYKGHCGKQRKTFNHNNLQPPSMITSWQWRQCAEVPRIFWGVWERERTIAGACILENTLICSWKIIFYKNKKIKKKWRSGAFRRSGGDAKQVFFFYLA